MRNLTLLLCVLNLNGAINTCKAQIKSPCIEFQNQAVDSFTKYLLTHNKQKVMLETPLQLVEKAISCDSSLFNAWDEKIMILSEMEEYREAIETIDEFFDKFKADSSYLIRKPPLYSRLNMHDSARYLYIKLNAYFNGRLTKDPDNDTLIYHYLFTKFKVYGWSSVSTEIEWYKRRYPDNPNLIALLKSIHP